MSGADVGAAGKKKKKIKPGSFQGLGLSQTVYKAIMKMGYKMPTPIQRKTIPTILEGQDVVAMARTGSGKTAAFLIPIIQTLSAHSVSVGFRAVVLSPTRELAMQTAKFCRQLGRFTGLRCCLLVGGQAMETQFEHLANNPDVVIATPGRLMHHILEAELSLSRVQFLVFDEADRLFELGFAEQLHKILEGTPVSRQCLLFSATLPAQLVSFSRAGVKNPVFVRLDVETTLSESLELWFLYCRKDDKLAAAISTLRRMHQDGKSTIMFVATRHHVEFFGDLLQQLGLTVAVVYGAMDQFAREEQISKFRRKKAKILVTTDVAARGIDIPLLDHVLNFDFPPSSKLFVHRSGRTARAGKAGLAVSLVTIDDLPYTVELMLFLGQKLQAALPGSGPAAPGRPLIGAVPTLEHEVESINGIINEEDTTINSLHKSMMHSYRLYNKTRPSASKQSVQRAKALLDECGGPAQLQLLIHPAFRGDETALQRNADNEAPPVAAARESNDMSTAHLIKELRNFRPKAEKVGNVLSDNSMRVMEQAKLDATAASKAQEHLESGMGLEGASAPSKAPRRAEPAESGGGGEKRKAEPERRPQHKGPRMSKRAKRKLDKDGGAQTSADDFDGFDVKVDGVEPGVKRAQGHARSKDPPPEQFYLSVEIDRNVEAKERGLEMEQYQLDLMPDEAGEVQKAKSVVRWDAKKKKYLPVMIGADGRVVKSSRRDDQGRKIKGEREKSSIYKKWAKTSKRRIQKVGELEEGVQDHLGGLKSKLDSKTVNFDNTGEAVQAEDGEPDRKRKPVVPFHGKVDAKHLTHKQKRMMKKREANHTVIHDGSARKELKTAAQMQKDKKLRDRNKVKQQPHLRKEKARQAKEKRMKMMEERQMKNGARTKSKMLIFQGEGRSKKGGRGGRRK